MKTKEKQKNRTSINEMFYNKKTQRLEKIDNRLVRKERRLENVNNKTKIQFNDLTQEDDLLVLQEDECKLSMKLLGKKEKEQTKFAVRQVKQLQDKKVLYEDVFEDSDVEYEILEDKKIKENIVIKNNNKETYEYQYLLTLENLTLKQEQNTKTLQFVNEKGKALFTIIEPVMFDSNNISSNDIAYEVKQLEDNKYLLTLKADESWINSKERVLPIYLDPVVDIVNPHPFKWYLFDIANSFNHLTAQEIQFTDLKWSNKTQHRLMLVIDDDLITLIKNRNLSSLKITFSVSHDCGQIETIFTDKSSNEDIFLSDFNKVENENGPCVFEKIASSQASMNNLKRRIEIIFDIADVINRGNRTFLFYNMTKEPETSDFCFLNYECNLDVEFDTFTSKEAENKEYRTYNIGNDILIHHELTNNCPIIKEINNLFNVGFIKFSLIDGNLSYTFRNFGSYNCNYNMIVEDNSSNDEFILYDEKGTKLYFKLDDDDEYYYVADKKLKLKKVNGKVVIFTNSKILKFIPSSDSKYYLLESITTNTLDNMILITYANDRIHQITDAYGNIALFSYDSNNKVSKITINTKETLNFFYDEQKCLDKITHMFESKIERTITLSSEIEDSYGYKGKYTIDLNGNFTFYDLITNKSEMIECFDNFVKITDNLGNETHIIKDKKGNIISKYSFASGGIKLKDSISYCSIKKDIEDLGTKIKTYYDGASIEADDEVIASGLTGNCIYANTFNDNPIYYLFMLETTQNSNTVSYSLTQDELDKLVHGNSYTYGLFIKTLSQRVPLHKLYNNIVDAECNLKLKIDYFNGDSKQYSRDIDTTIRAWQFIALSFTYKPTDSTISGITLSLNYTRPSNELKKNVVFTSPMLKKSKNYYDVSNISKYRAFKGVLKYKETNQYCDGIETFTKYDENSNIIESIVTDTFQNGVVLHNEYEYGDFNQLEKETSYFEEKETVSKNYEYSTKSYSDIDFSTCKLLSITTESSSKKLKLKYEYDQYGNQNPLFNEKDTKILEYDFYSNGDIKTEKYNSLADKNYEYQNSRISRISSSMDYNLMSYHYNCYYTYENGSFNNITVNNTLQYLFGSSNNNLTQNVKIKNLNTNVVNDLYSTSIEYIANQTIITENIGDDFKREYKYNNDGELEYVYENNKMVFQLTKNTSDNSRMIEYKVDDDTTISKTSLFDNNNKLYSDIIYIHDGFSIDYYDFDYINNISEYSLNFNDTIFTYKYKYNNRIEGRLEEVVMPYSVNKISYDSLGRVSYTEMHCNNSTVFRNIYTYQDISDSRTTQFVSKIEHKSFHSSGNETLCSEYGYQSNGNINSVKVFDKSRIYIYDTFNRLINEENQAFDESISYVYDVNGNLKSILSYNFLTQETSNKQFVYNGFNQLTKMLKSDGTLTEISYDELGNPTNINITRPCDNEICLESYNYPLVFERGTRLKSFGDVTFKYDENGMRISKQKGNTLHKYYVNGNIIHKEEIVNLQTNNIEETFYYFYDSTGIASFKKGNTLYYYLKDLTGNIIGIYNATGTLVVKYEYDAWGNHKVYDHLNQETTLKTFIGNINPFRYKGYYYDVETNLFYVTSRYYSPELCRWISPDSIEYLDPQSINGLNLYAYCGNDPINRFDPTGHAFISVLVGLGIAALIGAGIGAASYTAGQLIDYAFTGDFEWSLGGFTGSTLGGAVGGIFTFATGGAGSAFVTLLGAFVSGASVTAGTMIGENVSGDATHSWEDILVSSIISGGISMASVGIMSKIRIPKFNSGRGSVSAVSKQMYTKFRRELIKRVSLKTFTKMVAIEAYNGIAGNLMEWGYDISGAKDFMLGYF